MHHAAAFLDAQRIEYQVARHFGLVSIQNKLAIINIHYSTYVLGLSSWGQGWEGKARKHSLHSVLPIYEKEIIWTSCFYEQVADAI